MQGLSTLLVGISLLALTFMAIYRLLKQKNWRIFLLHLSALIVCYWLLNAYFDFPNPAPTPRGENDTSLVFVLYCWMLLGMLAQYIYRRFESAEKRQKKFDIYLFFAPIFASPIIFIPLLAALQNANIDLTRLETPQIMVFLVAFENGFFWKEYFDHRRSEKSEGKNEKINYDLN